MFLNIRKGLVFTNLNTHKHTYMLNTLMLLEHHKMFHNDINIFHMSKDTEYNKSLRSSNTILYHWNVSE